MKKIVTVQISEELDRKMKLFPDVNWSHVVRESIEGYCDARLNPNIEALIKKMKTQKGEAYANGQKLALEWFKQESVRYEDVNEIFQEFDETKANFDDHMLENRNAIATEVDDGIDPSIMWANEERRFWSRAIDNAIQKTGFDCEPSDALIEGFRDALERFR